ncbi:MAG: menaquinone biosynthetic enzyme MqnA/MqnD family protein [Phycisphaerales bacterium JB052]
MSKNTPSSQTTPQSPTRIAAVQFLNTISLIEGLETWNGCTLTKAIPSRIAQMLVDYQADIGLASIVDAADPQNDLALIPAGMIGCDGPTLTVRLFSSVPPEQITRVHADTDSHTSVMLADVLLRELHAVKAEFVPYDARERMSDDDAPTNPEEAWPETLLLIGDKVVVDSPPAVRYPHQIDLGEAWHTLTGLPFVYACWMCRRADLDTPMVDEASAMLERVRLRNTQRLDWLVSREAKAHRWPGDLAREYIGELLKFNIDDRARQAVALFFDKLRTHDLIDAHQPVWHESPAPTPATH